MIQDYEINVARFNGRQGALGSSGRVFIVIKKDAGRIMKARKEIDLRRIGLSQDVFAASMLADETV